MRRGRKEGGGRLRARRRRRPKPNLSNHLQKVRARKRRSRKEKEGKVWGSGFELEEEEKKHLLLRKKATEFETGRFVWREKGGGKGSEAAAIRKKDRPT